MNDIEILELMIARLPGLTSQERIVLFDHFETSDMFLKNGTVFEIEAIIKRNLKHYWETDEIRIQAELDLMTAKERGIKWVSWKDPDYPPLLREIYDPPAVLYYRGQLPDPEKPLVSIVGTRHPSPRSQNQAFNIAKELGYSGISVVSGLALGIDTMAHRGSLSAACPAYAVLGSGVDEIYPHSNRRLARQILEGGGAIISEYPPGTLPYKAHFPARNRIISGMAREIGRAHV